MKYRADIDGLRAIAILPVLLYHAGVKVFSGGFVGVDVFFVISGFLITRILADEFEQKRYSIIGFYERRIRRIIPPMIAVSVFIMLGTAVLYLPADFEGAARQVIAANLFASNLLFYTEAGYFDAANHIKPFLHTWSLAVEEQFYVAFPLMLFVLGRYAPRWLIPALVLASAISFAGAAWAAVHKPWMAFYLTPFRAWELFAGSLLALGAVPPVKPRWAREALSALGLGMILFAVFTLDKYSVFPGLNAAWPVVGAALLILAAPGTLVGRLLTLPPMVWIGLISYSLYLWHWPIIVFMEYATGHDLRGWLTVAAIAASTAAAYVSWRFVERPFRQPARLPARPLFIAAGTGIAILCVAGGAGLAASGWPQRYSPQVLALESAAKDSSPERRTCHRGEGGKERDFPLDESCVYGADAVPQVALWGDSHGVELSRALGELAGRYGQSIVQLTYSQCPAMLDAQVGAPACRAFNAKAVGYLAGRPEIREVILVARYDDDRYRNNAEFRRGVRSAVEALTRNGKQVALVFPTPTQPAPVPRALAVRAAMGRDASAYGVTEAEFYGRNAETLAFLQSLQSPQVSLIRIDRLLCTGGVCRADHGRPSYFDDNHLSLEGARYVSSAFAPLFDGSAGRQAAAASNVQTRSDDRAPRPRS